MLYTDSVSIMLLTEKTFRNGEEFGIFQELGTDKKELDMAIKDGNRDLCVNGNILYLSCVVLVFLCKISSLGFKLDTQVDYL